MSERFVDISESVLTELKASREGLKRIEWWLADQGLVDAIMTLPMPIRPDFSQREKYRDNGDMYVGYRAEGKHLGVDFTSAQDWPYAPHFMVCAKPAYDKAVIKPKVFYYLSRSEQCIAVVRPRRSESDWYVQSRIDRREGRGNLSCEYYFCPLAHVQFHLLKPDEQ